MNKKALQSKTFYLGLVTALAPLFPAVGDFVATNTEVVGAVLGGLIIVIRRFTEKKVTLL
jgi:hypothetical protein